MMSSRLVRPAFAAARRTAPRTAIRTYASPAVDSKPPVALFGLDGTYANALVSLPDGHVYARGCRGSAGFFFTTILSSIGTFNRT
jgi:hypothetical protein